jgi:hypothetical protein
MTVAADTKTSGQMPYPKMSSAPSATPDGSQINVVPAGA